MLHSSSRGCTFNFVLPNSGFLTTRCTLPLLLQTNATQVALGRLPATGLTEWCMTRSSNTTSMPPLLIGAWQDWNPTRTLGLGFPTYEVSKLECPRSCSGRQRRRRRRKTVANTMLANGVGLSYMSLCGDGRGLQRPPGRGQRRASARSIQDIAHPYPARTML